jgi:hypothetical protein
MAHWPWHPLVAPAPPVPPSQPGRRAVAAAPDDGTSREGSLDALLRFRGGESPARVLESDFAAAIARTMRWSRTVCLVFIAVAYAISVVVYATDGLPMSNNWAYLCVSALSLALIPGVRAARALVAEVAATTATALVLFAFDFDGPGGATLLPCSSGAYTPLMLYGALPLVAGVTFAPRWRVYAAMCVAHVARAAVELSPLGPTPALLVFFVSVMGVIVLYVHERHARFHFVRARVTVQLPSLSRARAPARPGPLHQLNAARADHAPCARAGGGALRAVVQTHLCACRARASRTRLLRDECQPPRVCICIRRAPRCVHCRP